VRHPLAREVVNAIHSAGDPFVPMQLEWAPPAPDRDLNEGCIFRAAIWKSLDAAVTYTHTMPIPPPIAGYPLMANARRLRFDRACVSQGDSNLRD